MFAVTGISAYKERSDLKNTEDRRKNNALITIRGLFYTTVFILKRGEFCH